MGPSVPISLPPVMRETSYPLEADREEEPKEDGTISPFGFATSPPLRVAFLYDSGSQVLRPSRT